MSLTGKQAEIRSNYLFIYVDIGDDIYGLERSECKR